MPGARPARAVVSASVLLVQLLLASHLALVDHTLTAEGQLVHAAEVAGEHGHHHEGPSLCEERGAVVAPDAVVLPTVGGPALVRVAWVSTLVFPTSLPPLTVVWVGRAPLAWAPKASPPVS